MSAELSVKLSADIKELQAKLKQAKGELAGLSGAGSSATDGLVRGAKKGGKAFKGLDKTTGRANNTLLEFNRVIQDAPFGIQGVGNNITQLVGNFSQLSQSAGGSKNALKAIVSSFLGSGGILFVVSAAVSLFTVYGDQLFGTKNKAEELAKAQEKASKAVENYKNSLSELNREQLNSVQSSGKQLVNLRLLINAAQDNNRSTEDRAKAVQELRNKFPDYFKDLSNEKILNGDLTDTYKELSKSIINRAKATGASNLIVKNAEKELLILNKISNSQKEIDKLSQDRILGLGDTGNTEQQGLATALQGRINLLKAGNIASQVEIDKIAKQNEQLIQEIENLGGIDLSGVDLKTAPELKIKPKISLSLGALDTLEKSGELAAKNLQKGVDQISKEINLDFAEERLKAGLNRLSNLRIGQKSNLELSLIALSERIKTTVQSGLGDAFTGIGQSIGEALVQGGDVVKSIGNGLLGSLGSFLSRMGQLLVEYGTLAVLKGKLDLAILAGGPVAIGAGIAAIAVGVALSAAGAALGSVANSSRSSGGGGSSSNGRSTSISSSNFSSGSGDGRVVFEIAGTTLVGVLNRTQNRNLSIGG